MVPKKKPPRKKTLPDVETVILASSARRCTLCFHLNGDLTEKRGQIAHLDEDRTNREEDNLAWMCLDHHSLYDSKTSQHKNYTIQEVKAARSRLYDLVVEGKHLTPAAARPYLQNEADKKTLSDFIKMVPSGGSISFLRTNDFAGAFVAEELDAIRSFVHRRAGPEHEFLDAELETKRKKFRKFCQALLHALGRHTFGKPPDDRIREIPKDWRFEKPLLFSTAVKEIHTAADAVCRTYDDLIRASRKKLTI
jgi:hypothetical protein